MRFRVEMAQLADELAHLIKLFGVIQAEVHEQRMLWLEINIVIFFAVDLVILLWVRH